jgi:sec-independent protein translocase protein TatB
MSGVGFWELIILLLIGLIVLGPERLPRVANQLGTWLGQARRMTRVMKRQLEEELDFEQHHSIRPAKLSAPPPVPLPREEHGDTYSPAHGSDAVGTGVGTDDTTDEATDTPAAGSAGNETEQVADEEPGHVEADVDAADTRQS